MKTPVKDKSKIHQWRVCPLGQHWVSDHSMKVPVSLKNPDGNTMRDGHCRENPSKKDQIYAGEIHQIAKKNFGRLRRMPTPYPSDAKNKNDFDRVIAGWTKFWNEILSPATPLDPNLIKALIRTESDFKSDAKVLASKGNWARGLMQITDQTVKILKDEKGELKDHLVNLNQDDNFDPVLNICAGIRWLFHKKNLLEHKLKRTASWEEAVMEYKSYTKGLREKDPSAIRQKNKFLKEYETLKNEK